MAIASTKARSVSGQSVYAAYRGVWSNVYVIGPLGGPYKIGVANDVARRVQRLQTGNPRKLFVEHVVPTPLIDAFTVELSAHSALADQRIRGEWFSTELAQAKATVDRVRADMEIGAVSIALNPRPKRRRSGDGVDNLWQRMILSDRLRAVGLKYRFRYENRSRGEGGARTSARMWEASGYSHLSFGSLDQLARMEIAAAGVGAMTGILLLRRVAGEGHMVRDLIGGTRALDQRRLERLLVDALEAVAGTVEDVSAEA